MRFKFIFRGNLLKQTFTRYYYKNAFNGVESVSGTGSDLIQTAVIREEIPKLLKKLIVTDFIDSPCGDFFWMKQVNIKDINYIGLDIVEDIVRRNKESFGNNKRKFFCKNIVTDSLPEGDLILIRDCLVHFSYRDIRLCLKNLKRNKIKYLLTTSFPGRTSNSDIEGVWRPLNLELAPFNFPKPIEVINENCTEDGGIYTDKSLLLWEIEKLPDL